MKPTCKTLATTLAALLALSATHAAVPIAWTNAPGMPPHMPPPVPHGSTVELSVTLRGYTSPPIAPGADVRLWYQTNGMGSAWFSAPAAISGNVITSTFGPEQDTGADRVSLFFGAPSNVFASAVLRLTHAPGFTPAAIEFPRQTLDFSAIELRNISALTNGWSFGSATDLTPATNYTDRALGYFAATGMVFRSASYGTPTRWTDATGCVWEVSLGAWSVTHSPQPGESDIFGGPEWVSDDSWMVDYYTGPGWYIWSSTMTYELISNDPKLESYTLEWYGNETNYVTTCVRPTYTNLVGRVALTNDIQRPPVTSVNSKTGAVSLMASDVSAYPAASGVALANTVDAWQSYWYGDEVRVTITNYFGSAGQPHLYIEQKVFDEAGGTNYYRTVWDEVTRQNILLARIVALETALAQKADRAWGFYDSHTGEYSPDGYTQVSSSNILLAAGMSYQKTITSGGEVWTLTATEPTQISGVGTNGFFRIEDGDGNALFEIVKGTRRTVGATASAASMAGGAFTIQYAVVADEHPVLQICSDLSLGDWADEGSTQRATVDWSGSSGNYTATVTPVGSQPKLFARASYEVGGNTYIKNNVASSLDRVVVNGTEYTVSVETVNGRKLMVLEVAP